MEKLWRTLDNEHYKQYNTMRKAAREQTDRTTEKRNQKMPSCPLKKIASPRENLPCDKDCMMLIETRDGNFTCGLAMAASTYIRKKTAMSPSPQPFYLE